MTKDEAMHRHQVRVTRLRNATDKKGEAVQIRDELVKEGYSQELAERAVRESYTYAKDGKK